MGKSSHHLVRDARRGDQTALLGLFDEYHLPLFRFAWRLTGSMADAEDIVQECFLALLRPDCRFDPERTTVRGYLFGAVRNQSWKCLRRRGQGEAPEQPDPRTPETEAVRGETAEAVAAAIAQLPETQREILLLAHYEQLSLAEIGEITQLQVTRSSRGCKGRAPH
jgi:RNA polymerase sigma-70 factor (ECF subfamily)